MIDNRTLIHNQFEENKNGNDGKKQLWIRDVPIYHHKNSAKSMIQICA